MSSGCCSHTEQISGSPVCWSAIAALSKKRVIVIIQNVKGRTLEAAQARKGCREGRSQLLADLQKAGPHRRLPAGRLRRGGGGVHALAVYQAHPGVAGHLPEKHGEAQAAKHQAYEQAESPLE